jgi:23S rRNA pseudouridine1911/1915/1917 synthase
VNRPLLEWLLESFPDTPKKRAKQWITAGRVRVGGVVLRKPQQLIPDPGATLQLLDRQAKTLDCGPNGLTIHPRLVVLHLDAALAVVNKGPGLLSVPAENYELSALSILGDVVSGRLRTAHIIPAAYRQLEPLPVHRLDQFTSGVFCMAMNPAARQHLIEQLNARTMKRQYVAYVEGRLPAPTGTWRNWLKLSDDQLRQFVIPKAEPDALEAVTHYKVVAEFGRVLKLRLRLESGRRHQIRVQAAHAGVPLVGDRVYNPRGQVAFDRQALHAETLTLEHPEQPGKQMVFTAALPKDLQQLQRCWMIRPR